MVLTRNFKSDCNFSILSLISAALDEVESTADAISGTGSLGETMGVPVLLEFWSLSSAILALTSMIFLCNPNTHSCSSTGRASGTHTSFSSKPEFPPTDSARAGTTGVVVGEGIGTWRTRSRRSQSFESAFSSSLSSGAELFVGRSI